MQTRTDRLVLVGAIALSMSFTCSADGAIGPVAVCHDKVESPKQCRWVNGEILLTNGTPSVRVLPRGENETYGVWPSEEEWMPANLKAKLTFENYIIADMFICPIKAKASPGAMRDICIDDAKILKVVER